MLLLCAKVCVLPVDRLWPVFGVALGFRFFLFFVFCLLFGLLVLQFQSFVIRFDDEYVRYADKLKGKSIHLFWKVFLLDGENTQEYTITEMNSIPQGYKLDNLSSPFEKKIWSEFWSYALQYEKAEQAGIRNAQIEAPGTMFNPGNIYTIHIEHDGGLRIDSAKVPSILKGERIPHD